MGCQTSLFMLMAESFHSYLIIQLTIAEVSVFTTYVAPRFLRAEPESLKTSESLSLGGGSTAASSETVLLFVIDQ